MSQTDYSTEEEENSQAKHPLEERERSPAEWVTFSVALAILFSIIGLVLYQWFAIGEKPPVITVEQSGTILETQGNFYVPFTITNDGGETADSVQVIAELRIDGEVEETGEQQIGFLAGGEMEEGAFIFSRNPEEGELTIRATSYQLP